MQKYEGSRYFEEIAKRDIENLRQRDALRSRGIQLAGGIPLSELTVQQQIAVSNGLPLPTSEDMVKRGNLKKHHKGKKRRNGR